MIVLGVDPGTRNLGWGVVRREGNRLTHLGHGVIRVGGDDALSVRLQGIAVGLEEVIERYSPAVGSVEEMFFDKNAQSAAKLGHARGVVLLCLERAGVTVREHTPSRVKQTLTGSGRAEKIQVARMVTAILALEEVPPHDAADALAIAICELRLDPRAHALDQARKKSARKSVPPHLAAAIKKARESRGER